MNFLAKELTKLGLTILEARVYIALLQRQLTTAGVLAKYTELKRSTVYTVLDKLVEKGLVSMTQRDAVKHYQAESPERIREFLQQKKQELESQEKVFGELVKDLQTLHETKAKPPKITIYEGKKGVKALLMRNLDDQPKEVLVIGQHMKDRDNIPEYTNRRIKMGIPTRVIIPDAPFAREAKKADRVSHRKTHLLPKKYRFPASIHIYDNSVAIFTYRGKDPIGLYVEDADISTTLKMTFGLLEKGVK